MGWGVRAPTRSRGVWPIAVSHRVSEGSRLCPSSGLPSPAGSGLGGPGLTPGPWYVPDAPAACCVALGFCSSVSSSEKGVVIPLASEGWGKILEDSIWPRFRALPGMGTFPEKRGCHRCQGAGAPTTLSHTFLLSFHLLISLPPDSDIQTLATEGTIH